MTKYFSLILVIFSHTWTTVGSCPKRVATCENFPLISNGIVLPGENQVGSTRQVQCNSGYEGNFAIHCLQNGDWSIGGSCNRGILVFCCYYVMNI